MIFRKGGKTDKRLKKISWRFRQPEWAENRGIWLPCQHKDIAPGIARQIYFGEYESKEIDIVAQKLEADDTVVEVGAGLGYLSAYCAKRIGSNRVHAFEANPAMIAMIQATYKRNRIEPTIHNALLGKGEGESSFFVEAEFWASSAQARSAQARAITVCRRDLNDELRHLAPTFLIVDIEGGEADFFAYAELVGVKKICLETHPDVIGNEGVTVIFSRLFSQGFVLDFGCIRKNVFFFYRS